MNLSLINDESTEFADAVKQKIVEFNQVQWQGLSRKNLGLKLQDSEGKLLAGISGKTFGNWLLIDYLWVNDSLRHQSIGTRLLLAAESQAKERGCQFALLDTLDFQAKPFYERHDYRVQWIQQAYPETGSKFFMVKVL
ncbi:GNAT family N-acetyltransferase [Shewanella sp. NKUCC05_KAH]|uniref:GNAT family N-acetyltransferase n=1 Tax=Shewanella TaxID=22 RepID=UPI001C5B569B|nr:MULTISPECIES: GNAT family N-acetyltransferase [unclassified Shewanella]MBW3528809.1 GNAT family N-acetyltransferase [Shewanella sp. NKUCC05_KAH]MCU7998681.1 GNAT family N-acetyltransferase [Shewanella sp. SM95]MCU8008825.1 GNAT family N-acetyltransferase [Shewanella sp. SM87]MCU8068648.1 GNAT family N-acetyltransferase [Shewanella sp. SM32]